MENKERTKEHEIMIKLQKELFDSLSNGMVKFFKKNKNNFSKIPMEYIVASGSLASLIANLIHEFKQDFSKPDDDNFLLNNFIGLIKNIVERLES